MKNIFIKLSKIITYICIAEIVLMVIFLIAIQIIGNLVSKESEGILTVSLTALGMGIAVKAGKYIFHK